MNIPHSGLQIYNHFLFGKKRKKNSLDFYATQKDFNALIQQSHGRGLHSYLLFFQGSTGGGNNQHHPC